jgi:hypothetical protein
MPNINYRSTYVIKDKNEMSSIRIPAVLYHSQQPCSAVQSPSDNCCVCCMPDSCEADGTSDPHWLHICVPHCHSDCGTSGLDLLNIKWTQVHKHTNCNLCTETDYYTLELKLYLWPQWKKSCWEISILLHTQWIFVSSFKSSFQDFQHNTIKAWYTPHLQSHLGGCSTTYQY